jgi:hypothetical protein
VRVGRPQPRLEADEGGERPGGALTARDVRGERGIKYETLPRAPSGHIPPTARDSVVLVLVGQAERRPVAVHNSALSLRNYHRSLRVPRALGLDTESPHGLARAWAQQGLPKVGSKRAPPREKDYSTHNPNIFSSNPRRPSRRCCPWAAGRWQRWR